MSELNSTASDSFDFHDEIEEHCVKFMKHMNADRKSETNTCDATLHAEGREYPVHKCIVGAFSEFFKTEFLLYEKTENAIKLIDMKAVVLEKILDFIYIGYVDITPEIAIDLLEEAEFLQIGDLKSICKDYMMNSICVENCLKFLAYGQLYNLDDLCKVSRQVFFDNVVEVTQQKDFCELNFNSVSFLLNTRRKKIHEKAVFSSIVQWVKHNMDQRRKRFPKLFSLLVLSNLPESFLTDCVLSEPLVTNSLKCLQQLVNPSSTLKLVPANSDKFVLIGGDPERKQCISYNVKGKHIENLPDFKCTRSGSTVVRIKHRLYAAGECNCTIFLRDGQQHVEMLNLKDPREWMKIAEMSEGRRYAASSVLNGQMIVTGGEHKSFFLSSCETYNPELNRWMGMKPMLKARSRHGMASLNGLLYCVGGYDGNYLSSAECYNEKIDEWKGIAPMPTARSGLAVVALNGYIYAIGGHNVNYLHMATVERYNPETNTWTKCADLNIGRADHGACVMNGNIYIVGGISWSTRNIYSLEEYNEAEDSWRFSVEDNILPHEEISKFIRVILDRTSIERQHLSSAEQVTLIEE